MHALQQIQADEHCLQRITEIEEEHSEIAINAQKLIFFDHVVVACGTGYAVSDLNTNMLSLSKGGVSSVTIIGTVIAALLLFSGVISLLLRFGTSRVLQSALPTRTRTGSQRRQTRDCGSNNTSSKSTPNSEGTSTSGSRNRKQRND